MNWRQGLNEYALRDSAMLDDGTNESEHTMKLPDAAAMDQIEDGMGIPVVLRFVPRSCTIVLKEYSDGRVPPMIVMGVELERGISLRSTNGKDIGKVKWTVEICRGPASREYLKVKGSIGMVNYSEEYESIDLYAEESCHAWAYISDSSFSILLDFVMSGRMPSTISIHAFGSIRHGWEPDGSGKDWDLESEKPAAICQVELDLELNQKIEADEVSDGVSELPTARDFLDFEQRLMERIKSHVLSINWKLSWIVLLLLVLVVIIFLKA